MYTENDTFTTVSGVEAYVQRGAYTASSIPTQQQVIDFAAHTAGCIELTMATAGLSYTVPNGASPIPATQPALNKIVTQMNAIGAAAQAVLAHEGGESPIASQKATDLLELYDKLELKLVGLLEDIAGDLGGTPGVASSVSSGGVQDSDFPPGSSETLSRAKPNDWSMNKENW